MRRDLVIKSGNLATTSDFRVVARIKPGFVPSLDAVTYKTRVKRLLKTLHGGRSGMHEYELARVLSDAVERVGVIHSVGIAVLEPEDKVLLTVTFDGAWEAYVRVIWQKVTRLLDLIFCNTEDYVVGYESSYEEWGRWLKRAQTEAVFLYTTPALTVDDTRYLRMQERVYRREAGNAAEARVTRIRIPSSEDIAQQSIFENNGVFGVDPTNAGFGIPLTIEAASRPPFAHGVRSLVGLYRLADLYPPGTDDGKLLLRAAHELLPEFVRMLNDGNSYQEGIARALMRFPEAIRWLQTPPDDPYGRRFLPLALPVTPPLPDPGNVQGGILRPYPEVDHGCLLLLQFTSPAAMAAFLNVLRVTSEVDDLRPGQIATNIGLTVDGLRVAGLSEDEVNSLPEEFVQGMQQRAGLLGDLRWNHPRRWRLPALNWHLGANAPDIGEDDPTPRVDLAAVHAVIQVRLIADGSDTAAARAVLMTEMQRLVGADPGVKALSLQWMQRQRDPSRKIHDHFGFLEGNSDPVFRKSEVGRRYPNQVHLGEILCGYPNLADSAAPFQDQDNRAHSLLCDGSFLAVRKLRQDVEALEEVLEQATRQQGTTAGASGPILTREQLLAKMMGRWPKGDLNAGQPLTRPTSADPKFNDFNFDYDQQAELCPFHAHIRRANPRIRTSRADAGSRPPRIMRRGMSYGTPAKRDSAESLREERGLVFMAYNASLGEQFEVIQRWLAGGNSSGSYSGDSDPLLGLAEPGRRRYFRFEHEGQTVRVALDGSDRLHDEPRPFVRLEWGTYLFAPSRKALADLQDWAAAQGSKRAIAWSADAGEAEIVRLRDIEARLGELEAIDAWKAALEDPDAAANFVNASIWAAIRERHGGVLRTPYGILVADRDMVEQVFADPERRLTSTGYIPRMRRSFGVLYLGLDPKQEDGTYEQESEVCNRAIMALDRPYSFELARKTVLATLQRLADITIHYARIDGEDSWDLTLDARELLEPLLAVFCEEWFGLSEEGGFFRRAGYRWDWKVGDPPNYPGHFLSPSRYIFQPHPGPEVESIGAAHGIAVRSAMIDFLNRIAATTTAPVTRAVLDSPRGKGDIPFVARTVAGAMMGFIPTVEGNLRRILNEWLREGNLWSLRARHAGTHATDFADACNRLGDDFIPTMQLRAVPELIWRTATVSHTLGSKPHQVEVHPGEIIVAGAVSATQQSLGEGRTDLYHAFGGNRRAANHPTHACPGADPALAVMIGFFSALVESGLPLRAGPGPLTIAMGGRLAPIPDAGLSPVALDSGILAEAAFNVRVAGVHAFDFETATILRAAATTPIVTLGDSWLYAFPLDYRPSLITPLSQEGYGADHRFGVFGARLEDIANESSREKLRNYFTDSNPSEPPARALLIGGGGNDVVDGYSVPTNTPLYAMLRQSPNAGDDPLIEDEVHKFIDLKLAGFYRTILDFICVELKDDTDIPILVHGYDHPIPDGRGILFRPWLKPVFDARGISDLTVSRDVMRRLIDRLNAMVATVAAGYPGRVHPINLTGTLARDPRYQQDYKLLWDNELHPNMEGYLLLAKVIAQKLNDIDVP